MTLSGFMRLLDELNADLMRLSKIDFSNWSANVSMMAMPSIMPDAGRSKKFMDKPHIAVTKFGGKWRCSRPDDCIAGRGDTPAQAYRKWKEIYG